MGRLVAERVLLRDRRLPAPRHTCENEDRANVGNATLAVASSGVLVASAGFFAIARVYRFFRKAARWRVMAGSLT